MRNQSKRVWWLACAGVVGVVGGVLLARKSAADPAPAVATPPAPATTAPAAAAPTSRPAQTPEQVAAMRLKFLAFIHDEYARFLKSSDWVTRGLAVISLSRFPTESVTKTLIEVVRKDAHPVVRVLAWEALRSRAALLDAEQQSKWVHATWELAGKGTFKGELRVGVASLLRSSLPSPQARAVFAGLFVSTAARTDADLRVLEELGKAVAEWRAPEIVDDMIRRLRVEGDALRAAYVLEHAGCPVRPNDGGPAFVKWWAGEKAGWKVKTTMGGAEPWRDLSPGMLGAPMAAAAVDPYDKRWRAELEMRRPDIKSFDVAFAIDVSGSMGSALKWMGDEVGAIMQALGVIAREPRIGLTFFDCKGGSFGVKSIPLTGDVALLKSTLTQAKVQGGGDELVLEGIRDALKVSRWSTAAKSPRAIVIVGDEEVEAAQVAGIDAVVAESVERGFRFYVMSPDSRVPRTLEQLAERGNGASFALDLRGAARAGGGAGVRGTGPGGGLARKSAGGATARARAARMPAPGVAAGADPFGGAAAEPDPAVDLIMRILSDAVTPEYRDRIEPLVRVVLAMHGH
ncbi:MAG TPA: VWA domain-containing protein [Tepidisphaeraceae bacterium]|nr:VWA domain-containing protein [Tepidisphaeraceae bacterium]